MFMDDSQKDPFLVFNALFEEAKQSGEADPSAFCLATTGADNKPSARILLFKGMIEHQSHSVFSFFSNTCSAKGQDIAVNPQAEMLFYWPKGYHQVRIAGEVVLLSREQSEAYFKSRSVESQYSCIASQQSKPVESRDVLEERVKQLSEKYPGGEGLPCPETWQGYGLLPNKIEIWVGRDHRLHDRFVYVRETPNEAWEVCLLSP